MSTQEVDTVLVPVAWGHYEATRWLLENGYSTAEEDEIRLPYYYRFRQVPVGKYHQFITRKLDNGVKLLYGCLRPFFNSGEYTFADGSKT